MTADVVGPVTVEDLRGVLAAIGARHEIDVLPSDLGSPERTNVFIVGDVVVKIDLTNVQRVVRERAVLDHLSTTNLRVPTCLGSGVLDDGRSGSPHGPASPP